MRDSKARGTKGVAARDDKTQEATHDETAGVARDDTLDATRDAPNETPEAKRCKPDTMESA